MCCYTSYCYTVRGVGTVAAIEAMASTVQKILDKFFKFRHLITVDLYPVQKSIDHSSMIRVLLTVAPSSRQ